MHPRGRPPGTHAHPHFDDRGTLRWYTRWADATTVARLEGKKVLIEMGREACGNCRSLVEAVVPMAPVAKLLQEHFIGYASDVDDPEKAPLELAMEHLSQAMMLPFVMFTDAEGSFLAGSHGAVSPEDFLATLRKLTAPT